ncbi:hypothetical protein JXM83_00640 [Candidatus Woesearchaeota archaeon]|nr:hypothetical protein [Candidatus Woesearchaeota archaeon]
MRKFCVLFVLVFILSSLSVLAELEVSVKPVQDSIFLYGEASFDVTVKNLRAVEDSIEIFTKDTDWIIRRNPLVTSIGPHEIKTFTMYFILSAFSNPGPKGVDIAFKTSDDKSLVKQFYIYVSPSETEVDFNPSARILTKINNDGKVDPREKVSLKLELKNRNALDLGNIQIVISGKNLNAMRNISLGPYEETTEYFDFKIDSTLVPQKDYFYVELKRNNLTFEDETFNYEIISYSPFFRKDVVSDNFFFKEDVKIILSNIGNIDKNEEFKVPTSFVSKFFFKSEPKAEFVTDDSGSFLVWHIKLSPQETYELHYVKNLRPIIYTLLLGFLVLVCYFVFRSPIVLRKEVFKVHKREGGIYELKVIVYVKNRCRKQINNLQVMDRVPHMAEVIRESYLGSIKPDRILHDSRKGALIKWLIPNIESLEERIITYKIRSKFSILGKLALPRVKSKFVTKSGRIRVTYSNKISVEN